ncbi:MAG TPA: hypothetical protein VFH51_11610 [Myxococcota bacterium]|nr:hypothetical protein [Myxococcota bacterium]
MFESGTMPFAELTFSEPAGEFRVWSPKRGIFCSSGTLSSSMATQIMRASDVVIAEAGWIIGFHHWWDMEGYETDARRQLTAWCSATSGEAPAATLRLLRVPNHAFEPLDAERVRTPLAGWPVGVVREPPLRDEVAFDGRVCGHLERHEVGGVAGVTQAQAGERLGAVHGNQDRRAASHGARLMCS